MHVFIVFELSSQNRRLIYAIARSFTGPKKCIDIRKMQRNASMKMNPIFELPWLMPIVSATLFNSFPEYC